MQYGSEFEPPLLPGARRAPRSLALDSRYEALLVRLRSRPQWQRVPLSEQSVRQAARGRVRPCAFVSEQYAGGSCVESSSQVRPGGPNLPRASPPRRDVPRAGSHQGRKVVRGEFSVLRCKTWAMSSGSVLGLRFGIPDRSQCISYVARRVPNTCSFYPPAGVRERRTGFDPD